MAVYLDWTHLITFVLGATVALLKSLLTALVSEPAKILMTKHRVIRICSATWPFKSPIYSGHWTFEWLVESATFPKSNTDKVIMHKFLKYVAAELRSTTTSGSKINYGFVGELDGAIITGRWYDTRNTSGSYYGSFQVITAPTMDSASGKWVGFAKDGSVKADALSWKKA